MSRSRKYYSIREDTAKMSHDMMSFSDYKSGSETAEYKTMVDHVYDLADKVAEVRPEEAERGYNLADRYAYRMAENINRYNEIGTRCPSVMISGASNFPTAKKRRQVDAWDKCMEDRKKIQHIADKLISIINGKEIIKSGEPEAVQKLEKKIETLKAKQEMMKAANAYYKKNGTLKDFPQLSEEQVLKFSVEMERLGYSRPFPSYCLTNNRQNLKKAEERLEAIKQTKDQGDQETEEENGLYTLIENTEIMRVQFEFDGKPDDDIRTILKANGFRWSPKAGRWQRQLTRNGKIAAQRVVEEIRKLQET